MSDNIWAISDSRAVQEDLSGICNEPLSGQLREYDISDLSYYLLNPNPIKVEDRVIGCRVKYKSSSSGLIGAFSNLFKSGEPTGAENSGQEEIISSSKTGNPSFSDRQLNLHFIKINEMLRPYDPVQKKLAALDRDQIEDITAICEEIGGSRYPLKLSGNINEKINFISNSLSKKTRVIFSKAYLLNGLFEMRGIKFETFRSPDRYRLIKFPLDNRTRHCVLSGDDKLEYWIDDNMLVNYLLLFEHSIRTDPGLREALKLCADGKAKPLKLFFSKQLDQKYSEKHVPETYREIFDSFKIPAKDRSSITDIMNKFQSIVFFSYAPLTGDGNQQLYTNISVMHDFKALEQIKSQMPLLYSEINKKAAVSGAGKLYLLDSIRESQNV